VVEIYSQKADAGSVNRWMMVWNGKTSDTSALTRLPLLHKLLRLYLMGKM
jgi:hypothetical protein